ncbi:MAG TPA: DUF1385 domain-containing protein [Acidimicrobiia bacterium]|nr:DUF1385 domain-containing protein [Acidimicrobiia bacterium]
MPGTAEPRYMGGQAVLEGVMMRGATTYAVAARLPTGEIELIVRDVPGWAEKYRHIPLVRGVMGLGESLGLGGKALAWSANRQIPEDEQISERAMGWTMAISMIVFSGLFLVLPAVAGKGIGNWLDFLPFQIAEAALRVVFFIGYLLLIARMRDIRRVFEYHGAEHKTIAAYENGVELTPETAQQFTTAHVRCGTNFLLTVMVIAILVYSVVPTPTFWSIIVSRIVLIPVIAGLGYEVIRYAAKHMHRGWVRTLMRPGLLLQRLTTREPSLDQLEVAIASLRAVLSADQLAEVEARRGVTAPPALLRTA